jgi:hypothetical protein
MIGSADVDAAIGALSSADVQEVVLSPHDSTPWTMRRFADRLGPTARPVRVGETLTYAAGL